MKRSAWRYLWKSEDIRKKLLITLALLVLYRLAANIPVPGINRELIRSLVEQGTGAASGLIGMLNLLSGGTMSNFSILAMGVYPYITAQIILQLLIPIIPALEARLKEDPRAGQQWMEKWTIVLTIPMALLSAIGQINIFNSMVGGSVLDQYGFTGAALLPTVTTLLTMVSGTMLGVWLGQLISEFGIPNQGLSLIIFSGIVSQIPSNFASLLSDRQNGWWMLLLILLILCLTIFAIVFVQQGRRNVPVLFPGRRMGNRMSMPVRSNLPLMVNMAGMIPLIFAQAILTFPGIVASYFVQSKTEWVANYATGSFNTFSGHGAVLRHPVLPDGSGLHLLLHRCPVCPAKLRR
jgi:preprotein translocase subunit SecY